MLIGIEGNLGMGKTLAAVFLGNVLASAAGAHLRSNMEKMKGATPVRSMDGMWRMENSVMVWDEMWITADSRLWKDNVRLTDFMMLTRKKGIIIIYTAQKLHMIDKRIREITDWIVHCEKKFGKIELHFIDTYDGSLGRIVKIGEPELSKIFYNLYDTKEIPLRIK